MVIVYNFKSFFDDNSSKKGLLRRIGLKVRVDNHLKAIETEQSETFSSKFSKYILLF